MDRANVSEVYVPTLCAFGSWRLCVEFCLIAARRAASIRGSFCRPRLRWKPKRKPPVSLHSLADHSFAFFPLFPALARCQWSAWPLFLLAFPSNGGNMQHVRRSRACSLTFCNRESGQGAGEAGMKAKAGPSLRRCLFAPSCPPSCRAIVITTVEVSTTAEVSTKAEAWPITIKLQVHAGTCRYMQLGA